MRDHVGNTIIHYIWINVYLWTEQLKCNVMKSFRGKKCYFELICTPPAKKTFPPVAPWLTWFWENIISFYWKNKKQRMISYICASFSKNWFRELYHEKKVKGIYKDSNLTGPWLCSCSSRLQQPGTQSHLFIYFSSNNRTLCLGNLFKSPHFPSRGFLIPKSL